MDTTYIFKRVEKKYLLTNEQYRMLFARIGMRLKPDRFGRSTVISLYLDTPDHLLIRNSIDATVYKEKLRLRSYGTPNADTVVYLELKKKFEGVVYKRRVAMKLADAERYFRTGEKPFCNQVISEIDYAMRFYGHPLPAMLIACEREAWFDDAHPDLRLTFDSSIRYRESNLKLSLGSAGILLIPDSTKLLEIKTGGAMPLWLVHALEECQIVSTSFSKYGTAYLQTLQPSASDDTTMEGGIRHVSNL